VVVEGVYSLAQRMVVEVPRMEQNGLEFESWQSVLLQVLAWKTQADLRRSYLSWLSISRTAAADPGWRGQQLIPAGFAGTNDWWVEETSLMWILVMEEVVVYTYLRSGVEGQLEAQLAVERID
jgi:hypothetical protein